MKIGCIALWTLITFNFGLAAPTLINFHETEPGLFRMARPTPNDLQYLKEEKKIKTVLNLENDKYAVANEKKWAQQLGLNYQSVPMSAFSYPSDQLVDSALAIIRNSAMWPIVVHCKYGRDRTGLIIGLYRVEDGGWSATEAYDEMINIGFNSLLPLDKYYRDRTGLSEMLN